MPSQEATVILQNATVKGPLGEIITTYAEFVDAYGEPTSPEVLAIVDFIFGKTS